ncbi:uncharacterized protein METZ01_LOCUS7345 [marine metagenome]|uniref:Lipid/polyisoprenoid-binding YceI-like domain-containing protein n=1 Tax=marine metagenome TaxID=408172 RepID=A0A381NIZ1_9ZZZZ
MRKNILIFLILIIPLIDNFSQDNVQWMLDSDESYIEYQAKHLLHKWIGINNKVRGVFFLKDDSGKIAVAANIADFDSGISNRDSNALRVLDAFNHPQVKFYSDQILISEKKINLNGELDLHGIKINKNIDASFLKDGKTIRIEGNFPIVLTDFSIELPSLMLKKIEDFAKISYKLVFKRI